MSYQEPLHQNRQLYDQVHRLRQEQRIQIDRDCARTAAQAYLDKPQPISRLRIALALGVWGALLLGAVLVVAWQLRK